MILNLTVPGATADSFLTVFPAGDALPTASNVKFAAGRNRRQLGGGQDRHRRPGELDSNAGSTNVIIDVVGYFATT